MGRTGRPAPGRDVTKRPGDDETEACVTSPATVPLSHGPEPGQMQEGNQLGLGVLSVSDLRACGRDLNA